MNSFDVLNPEDFIAQGDVFLMEHEQVDGKHYMVVLNLSPESSDWLVLGVLTSQIEKRKRFFAFSGRNPATLVEFEYFKASAVDCNEVKEIEKTRLLNKIRRKEAKISKRLPDSVIRKIIDGVILGTAPKRLKKLVSKLK